jgi:putative salt-induced outer membrane protein YdiY
VIRRLPLPALVLLALLAPAPSASADEVQLANGNRFTGRTVSLAGGTLTFATPYGDVQIPWMDVVSLTVDEPMLVTTAPAGPTLAAIAAGGAPGQAVLEPGGAVPLAGILALARPEPALVLDGGANAGFVTTTGNSDVNSLRLDGDILARASENRYAASAAVNRAEDRGAETARNWTTSLKYDRFVSPRLYVNANTILTSDRFRDLALRTALGLGVGYQLLSGARATLTTDAGFGYVNENLESQPDDSYAAARESTALEVFLIPERVQLFHQHDGYFGITGDDNLFVKTQNGVRLALAAGFVTTLRYDLDYDRSPALGRRNTDRTFALTLGYRF